MAEQIYDKGTYIGAYLLCGNWWKIASLAWQPMAVTAGASVPSSGIAGLLITTFWMGTCHSARADQRHHAESIGLRRLQPASLARPFPHQQFSSYGRPIHSLVLGGLMAPSLTRDRANPRGFRWLIVASATVALVVLFQFVKARVLAGFDQ